MGDVRRCSSGGGTRRWASRTPQSHRAGGTEDAARNVLLLLQWRRCGKQIEEGRKEIDVGLEELAERRWLLCACECVRGQGQRGEAQREGMRQGNLPREMIRGIVRWRSCAPATCRKFPRPSWRGNRTCYPPRTVILPPVSCTASGSCVPGLTSRQQTCVSTTHPHLLHGDHRNSVRDYSYAPSLTTTRLK